MGKRIVTVKKITKCRDCPFVTYGRINGWYGNSNAGGYRAYGRITERRVDK